MIVQICWAIAFMRSDQQNLQYENNDLEINFSFKGIRT